MSEPGAPKVPALLALTFVTGLVDAASVLGMGRVFVANMTGNVVFLGFALAGAENVSIVASLVAIAAFLGGALIGGRLSHAHVRRGVTRAFAIELACLAIATAVATLEGPSVTLVLIVLLGLAMGIRNAVVRSMAIPDMTTTVLTLTLTGLAADSSLAGGTSPRWARRVAAAVTMLVGALAGALLLRLGLAWVIGAAAIVEAVAIVALERVSTAATTIALAQPAKRPD
ncbi:YoaK family protein [Sandaracinus amylolyticus]|uniref:YoaK family protein n=1 Tax=Sandaracinus amylolyticus TaxID=927083 RepID=UPI001F2B6BBC|nr:YoaK family protein [Sandaracinus amylolyticus]UJR83043.1 Hypothetical protein I5071_51090 [Sandaracinus amylolyticus]